MKNTLKISSLLFLILILILLSPSITAADFPAEIAEVTDEELAVVEGLGFDIMVDQSNTLGDNNIKFSYSGNHGNAFRSAEGIMNVTNISGNHNIVQNLINLKINIFNIDGDVQLGLERIQEILNN